MSFSDAEREAILARSCELLERKSQPYTPIRAERTTPQREPFIPEWVPEAKLDIPPPAPPAAIDWRAVENLIDRKITAALGTMHERLMAAVEVVAEEVGVQGQNTANDIGDAVRSLRIELSELAATLAELRTAFATERERQISDLPALSAPRRDLN